MIKLKTTKVNVNNKPTKVISINVNEGSVYNSTEHGLELRLTKKTALMLSDALKKKAKLL